MKSVQLGLLFILTAAVALGGAIIKDGSLIGRSDGNNVTIQWGTADESSVKEFTIERRSGTSGDFIAIGSVAPKGNNSFYEFVDQSAFKTSGSIYQYRIKMIEISGNFSYSQVITVSHNVSGVKRTWGSLKAMFR